MPQIPNLTGRRFGRLTVECSQLDWKGSKYKTKWRCRCDCGDVRLQSGTDLLKGKVVSCGCKKVDTPTSQTHGHGGKRNRSGTYQSWASAKSRCSNPSKKESRFYLQKGITMCERWRDSFENFLSDMGEKPEGLELDRIDNDGPYSPENCRWATRSQQVRNRSNAIRVQWNGVTKTLPDWADHLGLSYDMLKIRHQRGWTPERMFTQQPGDKGHRSTAYRLTQPPFARFRKRKAA